MTTRSKDRPAANLFGSNAEGLHHLNRTAARLARERLSGDKGGFANNEGYVSKDEATAIMSAARQSVYKALTADKWIPFPEFSDREIQEHIVRCVPKAASEKLRDRKGLWSETLALFFDAAKVRGIDVSDETLQKL